MVGEFNLSKKFEEERFKVNDAIRDKDERVLAHCHCSINKLEEDVKEFIKRKNAIPNKSLELSGLDLAGFSQDDVWEKAIEWFKSKEDKLLGDKLK